jgi:class 3 adenylate cyclase
MTSPVYTTIEPTRGYARSGDIHIAYQVLGDGPAEMVHVLPFGTPVEIGWELPQIARWWTRIGAFTRSIIFDQRGVGSSDRPESPPTVEEQVADIEAVVDAIGAERFALAAYSQASPAGIAYAARHPERVTQLVLYAATARVMEAPDYPEGRSVAEARAWVAALAAGWGNGGTLDHNQPSVAGDAAIRDWFARAERTIGSPAAAVKIAKAMGAADVRASARSLRVPTLVLHRRQDPAIPFAQGEWLAQNIPESRFIELEGRDHALYFGDTSVALQEIEEWVTGTRPVHRAERILTTLMFTDIAQSTQTAATLGDAEWDHLVTRHDAVIRRELRYQGATELNTTGDGFLAQFPTATAAVAAARAIRRRVQRLGVQLRIGIHLTECELVGANVGGVGVHVAARICSLAEPGEILVSGTVADVLIGSGTPLSSRGEHVLKGAPGRWQACAVEERRAEPREDTAERSQARP